jgi:hypothetical protein
MVTDEPHDGVGRQAPVVTDRALGGLIQAVREILVLRQAQDEDFRKLVG